MRPRLALFLVLACSSALALLVACSSDPPEKSRLPVSDDIDSSKPKTDAKTSTPQLDGGGPVLDGASSGPGRVYAHTANTLYLYEPIGGTLKEIGTFTFEPASAKASIIDLAVDRTGNMYGTTFGDFFRIDTATAKCTWIAATSTSVDYPNALSFVPAGTADPTKEALVGYATTVGSNHAVTYVQIDTTTGQMTTKGKINASSTGPQYRSSGDFISLIQDGNRTYATVKLMVDGGLTGTDLLAEVDPSDGHIKRIIGDTKQNDIWGLGYWAGKGYGFASTGRIIEIDMTTGSSTVVQTLMDGGTTLPWYGAGVTTQAPIH